MIFIHNIHFCYPFVSFRIHAVIFHIRLVYPFESIHILLRNRSGICLPACSCPRPCIASAIVCLLRHPKARIPDRRPAPAPARAGARRPAARLVPGQHRQAPVPVPAPVMMARRRPAAAHADTQRPLRGGEGRLQLRQPPLPAAVQPAGADGGG